MEFKQYVTKKPMGQQRNQTENKKKNMQRHMTIKTK